MLHIDDALDIHISLCPCEPSRLGSAPHSIYQTMSLTRAVEPSVIQKTLSRKQARRSAVRNRLGASVSTRTFGSPYIAMCNLPRCVASNLISFHRIELC